MRDEALHPVAWTAWLVAAALPPLTTRNPLYLALTLLVAGINFSVLGQGNATARGWASLVRFGATLWLLTIPFTMLTNHHGDIVLFTLPESWPVIGGPITLESLLYGLTGGLAIIGLLLIFSAFNLAVDQARLLRMAPAFAYQAGVVTAIAVAFVPQMASSWQDIREAQQVRGHRFHGLRDLLPLIMPLLVTALERAMQLAESMEARGFGGTTVAISPRDRTITQTMMLAGLASLGIGLGVIGFLPQLRALGAVLTAFGVLLLMGGFWQQGRTVHRTTYRRWVWGRRDRIVLAVGLTSALIWLAAWILRGEWLFYYPYPPYSPWPTFHPVLGLAIVLLAVPAFLLMYRRQEMRSFDPS
jgi:energy-coupling factor transport system permease protein